MSTPAARSAEAVAALPAGLLGAQLAERTRRLPRARAHGRRRIAAAFLVDEEQQRTADRAARRLQLRAPWPRSARRRPAADEDHASHVALTHLREERGFGVPASALTIVRRPVHGGAARRRRERARLR